MMNNNNIPESSEKSTKVPATEGRSTEGRSRSPRWGATTKLIVGLSLVAISGFLLFRFLNIVGPLLLAFLLAYLLYPISELISKRTHMPWRVSITLIFLVLLVIVLGSVAAGGVAIVEQVNSLIVFLQKAVNSLPDFINSLVSQPLQIGPFELNFQLLDVNAITQQIMGVVQPILSQVGTSVVSLATGAATVFGWLFFTLLVAYFVLAESDGVQKGLLNLYLPGYDEDFQRLGQEFDRIWNAFLRGQITIVLLTILIYNVLLGGLGVRFFFGLALLAGIARFIPYVGPFFAWTSYGLVAFFQGATIFGVSPLIYVVIVVGSAWLMDLFLDNFVVPRLMSNALKVHPAAVMVSALVAYNLLGMIGLVLAAPVLASVKLLLEYLMAKMFDQDPWRTIRDDPPPPTPSSSVQALLAKIRDGILWLRKRFSKEPQSR
jgi:predicted PurR-regulated permease PerM